MTLEHFAMMVMITEVWEGVGERVRERENVCGCEVVCVCVCVCIRVRLYAIARPNPLAHVNSTQRTMYARLFSKRVDLKEIRRK